MSFETLTAFVIVYLTVFTIVQWRTSIVLRETIRLQNCALIAKDELIIGLRDGTITIDRCEHDLSYLPGGEE